MASIISISMAASILLLLAVFYLLVFSSFNVNGEDDVEGGGGSSSGGGSGIVNGGAGGVEDPPEIVAKALLCFNDKYIYSGCEASCRLKESGNLEVPTEKTDEYCNGPCLAETHLVLDCINAIFNNFLFYNSATLQDVRDTIQAACGYGPQRGNFDVMEHIKAERGNAWRAASAFNYIGGVILIALFTLFT